MKSTFLAVVTALSFMLSSRAEAATLTAPAGSFGLDPSSLDDCYVPFGGQYLTSNVSGATCWGEAPILLPTSTVISSITVYYYDNSASCSVYAALVKRSVTSGSTSNVSSSTSTSSSASMQSFSLSGATLSSSSMYGIQVSAGYASSNGCRIYGYKITY